MAAVNNNLLHNAVQRPILHEAGGNNANQLYQHGGIDHWTVILQNTGRLRRQMRHLGLHRGRMWDSFLGLHVFDWDNGRLGVKFLIMGCLLLLTNNTIAAADRGFVYDQMRRLLDLRDRLLNNVALTPHQRLFLRNLRHPRFDAWKVTLLEAVNQIRNG